MSTTDSQSLEEALEPEMQFDIQSWNQKLKQAEELRVAFERQWFTNMAFYRGNQWARWVKNPAANSGQTFINPPASPHRKRLVFNKIKPIIRNEFTKLVKEEHQGFVMPNTSDPEDVAAAKAGEAIVDFSFYSSNYNKARRKASWWASITGIGIIKTYYDGEKNLKKNKEKGCVVYESPSPFHIFVPHLDMEDIQDQPWIAQVACYDPSFVRNTWNVDIQADTETSSLGFEQRFLSSINVNKSSKFKQVQVKEIWIKPCSDYPEGALAIYAGNQILHLDRFPYEHGEFPFQKIDHIPTGSFYSQSVIEDLIAPQKEYNLCRSQIAEARDMTSKPAFTATKGAQDVKQIRAVPGAIIEVQPGADPPKRLVNPDMPNYIQLDLDRTVRDIDEISGQFEVTKGRTPPGVEAASAIAFLQEENDTKLYHTIASIEDAVAQSGSQTLQLVQQYWNTERIISSVSKTNMQGVIKFKGSQLNGNTDYRVVSDSMAPKSRAAKQAGIMEMIKLGIVPPEMGLKHLQMSETSTMYDELHIDYNQAQRENLIMSDGKEIIPNQWDNHQVHVTEHTNFMKTQQFELLDEDTKSLFIEHYEAHQRAFVEEVQMTTGEVPNEEQPTEEVPNES